jgi:hypothetical protein
VYEISDVDIAVASLNAAVNDAMQQAIPRGYNYKSKFPPWFSYFKVLHKKNSVASVCKQTIPTGQPSLVSEVSANFGWSVPHGQRDESLRPYSRISRLKYYTAKNYYFHHRFKKKPTDCLYDRFSFYRKLVKSTIKSDRLSWLKSQDNLKSLPQHFWKYVSNFRKHRSGPIQLNDGGTYLVEPIAVADAFAKHFQSI